MNKNTRKRIISALTLCAVSATTLMSAGCGKSEEDKIKVAVITKQDLSFWHDVQNGANDAGKELGVEVLYNQGSDVDYPGGDNDFNTQIEYINYAIDQGVDAIVIAPNAADAELNEAFGRAKSAGIDIININSRSHFDGISSFISSSDIDGGAVAARHASSAILGSTTIREGIAKLKGLNNERALAGVRDLGKGAIAIIGHTASTADNRINGFKAQATSEIKKQLAKDGYDLSRMNLTNEEEAALFLGFYVEGERCQTVDAAYDEAKRILNENPGCVCFYATNTNTTLGVCQAVEELGLADKVYVIGYNSDDQEIKYLKEHVLDGTVVQNPYTMGYVGVRYAYKLANGNGVAAAVDTGVTYIDNDNLNDDYVQLLIKPENY